MVESSPGKNSTDFRMTIDAMGLLHSRTHRYDFCLVTSDRDFASLAKRIKTEPGARDVLGIGSATSDEALAAACTDFSTIEALGEGTTAGSPPAPKPPKLPR